MNLAVTVDTRRAIWWARAVDVIGPLIGTERATRLAEWGIWKLARYRIGGGQWRYFQ